MPSWIRSSSGMPRPGVALGQGDHEAQVGDQQVVARAVRRRGRSSSGRCGAAATGACGLQHVRGEHAGLDALGEVDFLLRGQQGGLADAVEINPDQVSGGALGVQILRLPDPCGRCGRRQYGCGQTFLWGSRPCRCSLRHVQAGRLCAARQRIRTSVRPGLVPRFGIKPLPDDASCVRCYRRTQTRQPVTGVCRRWELHEKGRATRDRVTRRRCTAGDPHSTMTVNGPSLTLADLHHRAEHARSATTAPRRRSSSTSSADQGLGTDRPARRRFQDGRRPLSVRA